METQIALILTLVIPLVGAVLIAAAGSPEQFEMVNTLFGSLPGRLVMLGYTWALLHHMLGGIRHFIWDVGSGFGLGQVDFLCWLSLILSLAGTVAIWVVAGGFQGVF